MTNEEMNAFLNKTKDELLAHLAGDDPELRSLAIFALHPHVAACPELEDKFIDALQDDDENVRAGAADMLGSIRPPPMAAVAPLITALKDPDFSVRHGAACALGYMRPQSTKVVEALIEALDDWDISNVAIGSLASIGALAAPAVPRIVEALKKGVYPGTRLHADDSQIAEEDPDPYAFGVEVRQDLPIRQEIVRDLGSIGPAARHAVGPLLELLNDAQFFAQAQAEYDARLAACGGDTAEVKMHPPGHLRVEIALALWKIAQHEAVLPTLTEAMRDADDGVRTAAVDAIHDIGACASSTVGELARALQDPDGGVRQHAARALGVMGPAAIDAVPAMARALEEDVPPYGQLHLAQALVELGPMAMPALPALVERVRRATGYGGMYEAKALWELARHEAAIEALVRLLQGPDFSNRFDCARILGEIGKAASRAVAPLIAVIENPGEDEGVRRTAKWAIGQIIFGQRRERRGDEPSEN